MRKWIAIPAALALLAGAVTSGCGSATIDEADKTPVPPASVFLERSYPFCSGQVKDKFTIGYHGAATPETEVSLYVICHSGDTVYHDSWQAGQWLAEGGTGGDSVDEDRLHRLMRDLIDGRTAPPTDSLPDSLARHPRTFGYRVSDAHSRRLHFDRASGRVLEL